MPTLEELRAENEAELKALEATIEPEPKDDPEEAEADEPEQEEAEAVEAEDWTKGEEVKEETGFVPDSTAAAIRRKYKAQAKEAQEQASAANAELERIRKELDALKASKPAINPLDEPKPESFETDRDYIAALARYNAQIILKETQTQQAAALKKQEQEARQSKLAEVVDQHYVRAAKLSEQAGISPEAYQASDLRVRQTVESVFPGGGDSITDALIANLGEGSEKVFYNLGVNQSRRDKFVQLLREDPNGLKATVYLGELKAQLKAPAKRETSAPAPMDAVQGDKQGASATDKLQKRYLEAHRKGNTQEAFNLKREAKLKGINVGQW
jgi:hypothetical protein